MLLAWTILDDGAHVFELQRPPRGDLPPLQNLRAYRRKHDAERPARVFQ